MRMAAATSAKSVRRSTMISESVTFRSSETWSQAACGPSFTPPVSTRAPPSAASLTQRVTRSASCSAMSGPNSVLGSSNSAEGTRRAACLDPATPLKAPDGQRAGQSSPGAHRNGKDEQEDGSDLGSEDEQYTFIDDE